MHLTQTAQPLQVMKINYARFTFCIEKQVKFIYDENKS